MQSNVSDLGLLFASPRGASSALGGVRCRPHVAAIASKGYAPALEAETEGCPVPNPPEYGIFQ